MAVYDEPNIVLVTVYCDQCGVEETNDYAVPAGIDSLDSARRYMAKHKSWLIATMDDLCPECVEELKIEDPSFVTTLIKHQRVWSD